MQCFQRPVPETCSVMATGYASADQLRDGVDWAKSHRPPPIPHSPPPAIPQSTAAAHDGNSLREKAFGRARAKSESQQIKHGGGRTTAAGVGGGSAATRGIDGGGIGTGIELGGGDDAASIAAAPRVSGEGSRSSRPRRGSLNFLRRTKTNDQPRPQSSQDKAADGRRRNSEQHTATTSTNLYTDSTPLPQSQPYQSRFLQAQNEKATSGSTSSSTPTMLRKASSKLKKADSNKKQQQEQQHVPRQPPHLPSLQPLHDIASFGGEGDINTRPDSVAIFNQAYRTSASPPSQPRTVGTNFSRPGNAMAPSSNMTGSSSPAYVSRFGPTGSSSPPEGQTRLNGSGSGEYVAIDPSARTDSMTNRGRFSYASSMANVNSVNSPRRVRRRKDPTPFK